MVTDNDRALFMIAHANTEDGAIVNPSDAWCTISLCSHNFPVHH
ncbi:hypothetical protein CULC0102_2185 [Corynebacterium ulcerans 0102]|nr:hypothetical protein CULC0102_2185 [Corynebacterium ulcerans 0102]